MHSSNPGTAKPPVVATVSSNNGSNADGVFEGTTAAEKGFAPMEDPPPNSS